MWSFVSAGQEANTREELFTKAFAPGWGFAGGSVVENPPANAEDAADTGSTPGSGGSPGGGNGNPLRYSCLGNPMDRGA